MTCSLRAVVIVLLWSVALPVAESQAGLTVDFADGANNVPATAAPFIFANGTASPITRTYINGSAGYTGGAFDMGAGVTAILRSFRSTDGALNTSTIRMIDRNDAAADFVSDWATVEPGATSPNIGLQLTLTGLATGIYNFSSLHDDTSNQAGVLDAQYSLDGGSTWVNLVDNASYGAGTTVSLTEALVSSTFGLSVRYLAGGGLFGGNGQTTDTVATNRLMPFNSFQLTAVPEPSSLALLVLAGSVGLAMGVTRRRGKSRCGASPVSYSRATHIQDRETV